MKNSSYFRYKKAFWSAILIFITGGAFAQSGMTESEVVSYLNIILVLIGVVALLLILVAVFTYRVLNIIMSKPEEAEAEAEAEEEPGMWANLQTKLTNAVPVEEEEAVMLDHDYDGIKELDNHLPPWWKWLFYATIVFAVIYLFAYHVIDIAPLSAEEYQMEMARAEEVASERKLIAGNTIDETSVEFVSTESNLVNGQEIFMSMCAACHRPDGGGSVGPNLTDEFWLHGGSISDIFGTIKYGVPEKGMISWEAQIKPADMQDLSSYIISIQGTNPPNAKEPEGEKYVPEESEPAPAEGENAAEDSESTENV